jgi:hypothetical protein
MVLEWNDLKFKRTVPIDKRTANIGRLYTAPGLAKYVSCTAKTSDVFPDNSTERMQCLRVEVKQSDEVIIEEGDDGLIQASLGSKKAEIHELSSAPDAELDEALTMPSCCDGVRDCHMYQWHACRDLRR